MDISKRIIIAFVAVSLIPILIISAISVGTIFDVSNENAADASDALKAEELANLERITQDTGQFIEERLQNYIDGVYIMEKYCEDLFNDRINASPQYSYFWDPSLELANGHPVPGLTSAYEDEYDSTQISFDVSCYYMPREYYDTPGDPFDLDSDTQRMLDISSNMDNVFRSLHEMSSDYIWLYMGFDLGVCDSHLFRNYPYDNLEYFWDFNTDGTDYNPNQEEWYTNAAALPMSAENVAFTGPYGDPSTGLVLSMGRPVYFDNGTLIGVVSADLTLDTILTNILNVQVLDSGYAYLLQPDGTVIAHPDFATEGQTVYELEFSSSTSAEAQAFTSIITEALDEDEGQVQFTKNGEDWYLTYKEISNTGFLLGVVVPASEVIAPAIEILGQVTAQTAFLTAILGGVLAAVAAIVAYSSYRRAQSVVEPIKEMTDLVKKMSTQDFTRSVSTSGAMYEEIGTTVDALLSFQEACRFGNQAFIRGDLNRALANYQNLLEISRRLNIDVGMQTMYLNIGNVFRQRGDTDNAMDHYRQSLKIAKELLEKSKEEGKDESDALARIASVYHNMALVEMDRSNYDQAISYLEDAEAIDRTLGNNKGLAKRFDAMGLVYMKEGRFSQAQSRFDEALETAKAEMYDRSIAYIRYHMGELFEGQNQWRLAEEAFNDSIRLGEKAEEYWLVVYAMNRLADVLDRLDKSSHEIRREAERLRRSILFKKSVIFVIDYSGSMRAQNRIRAAIEGAKEILAAQVNPQDDVSIIVFNSSYREILPLTRKGEYEDPEDSPIIQALDSLKYPNYSTAFHDALGKALESLDQIASSEHRWVIALTDGQDNSSEIYSLDALEGVFTERDRRKSDVLTIEGFIRDNHLDVQLIIIGVGEELKAPIDKDIKSPRTGQRMTYEGLLESVCDTIPQGQYVSVVDSVDVQMDIQQAFMKVGVMMAQLEVGGTTTDY